MAYEAKRQPDVYELIKSKWRWFMTVGATTMTSCWSADRDEGSGFDHMAVICDLIKIRAKAWKKSTTAGIEKVQAVRRENYLDNFW